MIQADRCLIIAEIAQAHDGSLGTAHAYIDAVADAGADAIKFQTHIAAAESTPDEPWRIKFSPQDDTRYEYWKRMEFTKAQWHGLKAHADERGILFISSAFSFEAVTLLEEVGTAAWKIASGEVNNTPMFEQMAATGLPFILSTGMSPHSEIAEAVARIKAKGVPLTLLQCTSMYPTPPEKIGINMLPEFRQRYDCPVGLSDHSGTIYPSIAAATLGASVLEMHVAFSRQTFGPDVSSSITIAELKQLVEGVRFVEAMRQNPVDKDVMAEDLAEMRRLFTKSVVARDDLAVGVVLSAENLTVKKPGTGIPAAQMTTLFGKKLVRAVAKDDMLQVEDLEA
ncbi:MAG: N-acetylneuraminate synthase family protein [Candidatus Promineifilaceae bacterium]